MQSLSEEKAHQIKLFKQLEKELEQIKSAPNMTDLESTVLQNKTDQEALQKKLQSAEEPHRSQYGALQAQIDEQEKHYKHLLTSSKNQISVLEKQLNKEKKFIGI